MAKIIQLLLITVLLLVTPSLATAANPYTCPGSIQGKDPSWIEVVSISAKVPDAADFSPTSDVCLGLGTLDSAEDYFFIFGSLINPSKGTLDPERYPKGTRFRVKMRLVSPREDWRWGIFSAHGDSVSVYRGTEAAGNPTEITFEGNSIANTSYNDPPLCTKTIIHEESYFRFSSTGFHKKVFVYDPDYRYAAQAVYSGRAVTNGTLVDLEGETIKSNTTVCQQSDDLPDGITNVYIPLGYFTALKIPLFPAVVGSVSDDVLTAMFKVASIGKGLTLRSFSVRRTFGEITSADGQPTSLLPEGLLISLGIDQATASASLAQKQLGALGTSTAIGLKASAKTALKKCVLKKKLRKGKKIKRKGSNIVCK